MSTGRRRIRHERRARLSGLAETAELIRTKKLSLDRVGKQRAAAERVGETQLASVFPSNAASFKVKPKPAKPEPKRII
jgi:hypothetical protein